MTDPDRQGMMEDKARLNMESSSHKAGVSAAMQKEQEKYENPEFLGQLQSPDVDSDVFDWVEDEYGPVFSGSHILGNRSEHYEDQQDLLNRNKAHRMVAEGTPGRLLRENPRMLALAQGIRGTEQNPDPLDNPGYRPPMASAERRVVLTGAEVATNRQTLSIGARGLDAVSSVTVENRSMAREESEEKTTAERVSGVFK